MQTTIEYFFDEYSWGYRPLIWADGAPYRYGRSFATAEAAIELAEATINQANRHSDLTRLGWRYSPEWEVD